MFYEIDNSLDPFLATPTADFIDKLDIIFTAHRLGNIILVPSRAQIRTLATIGISNLSRKTVDYISFRINDYRAACAAASRVISVCDDSVTTNYIIGSNKSLVSYNYLSIFHLITQKFFLAEAHRDINFALMLSDAYLDELSYPTSYISVRPLQGGGGALCHALGMEQISPCKGVVFCDRDTVSEPPPLKKNSTSDLAQQAAKALNLIDDTIGISPLTPFFASMLTWGYSLENYIGPNSLDAYFSSMNRLNERTAISNAFPTFPILNEADWFFWRHLNFKSGTPNLKPVLDRFKRDIGAVPPVITNRLQHLSSARVSADVVDWLAGSYSSGRWRGIVREAMRRDLRMPPYRDAIAPIAMTAVTMCAGDRAAHRS